MIGLAVDDVVDQCFYYETLQNGIHRRRRTGAIEVKRVWKKKARMMV